MRDKAAFLGGLGTCGRELCCTCWLERFLPVTIAMAREQGLGIVPENLSGPCGHLKCCLRYEYEGADAPPRNETASAAAGRRAEAGR